MPTIPKTKPGINLSSCNSTEKSVPSPPGIGLGSLSGSSPSVLAITPLKSITAISPIWAARPSTGTKVANFSLCASITVSTWVGSYLTSSALASKPVYWFNLISGRTSTAAVKVRGCPGS